MRVFCSCEDVWRPTVPGFKQVAEVDLQGRRAGTLCLVHPDVRAFWTALVTDLCKSYDIDGILFFNERNGPLLNATGSSHFQQIASAQHDMLLRASQQSCKGTRHRLRPRPGGLPAARPVREAALADKRPSDGYFVEFWRLLVEYPEIIAWDKLFDLGKHQVLADVRAAVKAIKPSSKSASISSTSTRSTRSSAPHGATRTWPAWPTSSKSSSTTTAAASVTSGSSRTLADRIPGRAEGRTATAQ